MVAYMENSRCAQWNDLLCAATRAHLPSRHFSVAEFMGHKCALAAPNTHTHTASCVCLCVWELCLFVHYAHIIGGPQRAISRPPYFDDDLQTTQHKKLPFIYYNIYQTWCTLSKIKDICIMHMLETISFFLMRSYGFLKVLFVMHGADAKICARDIWSKYMRIYIYKRKQKETHQSPRELWFIRPNVSLCARCVEMGDYK